MCACTFFFVCLFLGEEGKAAVERKHLNTGGVTRSSSLTSFFGKMPFSSSMRIPRSRCVKEGGGGVRKLQLASH